MRIGYQVAAALGVGLLWIILLRPSARDDLKLPSTSELSPKRSSLVSKVTISEERRKGFIRRAQALGTGPILDSGMKKWVALLSEWISVDPVGAFAYLESLKGYPGLDVLIPRATKMWFASDPSAAREYTAQKVRADESTYIWYLPDLIDHLNRTGGFDVARSFVGTLPQSEQVYRHFFPILSAYIGNNLSAAKQVIDSLPYAPMKPALYEALGAAMVDAMGWDGLDRVLVEVQGTQYVREAYTGAMLALHTRDPGKVAAWLNSQPQSADLDVIRSAVSQRSFMTNPESAVKVAASITEASSRAIAIEVPLIEWMARSPQSAEEWAVNSDIEPDVVARAIVAAEVPSPSFFERKIAAAAQLEPRQRDRSIALVFGSWSKVSPTEALKWLDGSTLPNSVKAALRENINNK